MTKPRSSIVSVSDTPYYHCVSRCVRRAFLCGEDAYSGQSFEHRRDWFIERLMALSEVFTIDVCAYAVMSNHCHLVLYIDTETVSELSMDDVIHRWCQLYRGPEVIKRYLAGETLSEFEQSTVSSIAQTWRSRLSDLSWYMRCLNEYIARRANAEDGCTGRFWEGRFKSQALLDEQALITAMAYVDLNPIRANMAKGIADSDKTSAQQRLQTVIEQHPNDTVSLREFSGAETNQHLSLPFNLQDYLQLVDWTGRGIRQDKRGWIHDSVPSLLTQLGIAVDEWLPTVTELQHRYELVMGSPERMKAHAESRGGCFYRGYRHALSFYRRVAA
ncbi:MAG: transposase [Gammaproteobacteria bacterium]